MARFRQLAYRRQPEYHRLEEGAGYSQGRHAVAGRRLRSFELEKHKAQTRIGTLWRRAYLGQWLQRFIGSPLGIRKGRDPHVRRSPRWLPGQHTAEGKERYGSGSLANRNHRHGRKLYAIEAVAARAESGRGIAQGEETRTPVGSLEGGGNPAGFPIFGWPASWHPARSDHNAKSGVCENDAGSRIPRRFRKGARRGTGPNHRRSRRPNRQGRRQETIRRLQSRCGVFARYGAKQMIGCPSSFGIACRPNSQRSHLRGLRFAGQDKPPDRLTP